MSNIKIINTAGGKTNETEKPVIKTKYKWQNFIGRCCIVSNFFIKLSQIIFMVYLVFFDTDIVEFSLRYIHAEAKNSLPNIERIWIYAMVASIFIISSRNFNKYRKMIRLFRRNIKDPNHIIVPVNMDAYTKDAWWQFFAAIMTLFLMGIMNYWNGMSISEYVLSWYYVITTVYYVLIHSIEGFILIKKKKEKKNGRFKPYW